MKKQICIAADLGASGGKMARGYFDGEHLEIGDYFDFPNQPMSLNGNLYWNLFALYNNILKGLDFYSREQGAATIGIDTWGASYGFLDKRGRLLEPVYHYRDLRTEQSLEKSYEVLSKRKLFELTGCQPNRSYTLPQLYSYIEYGDKIIELADKMLFLPDLLGYFLCGEISTERSIAGTSGLMKPEQDDWAWEVFEQLGIPERMLTDITDTGTVKGHVLPEIASITRTSETKVIAVPGHDTASAVVGIPGFGMNQVYLSIGTNINMGIELSRSIANDKAYEGGFKNAGVIEDRKILYRDFAAFWLLNELRRTWKAEGNEYEYETMMDMALSCKSKRVYVDTDDTQLNNAGGNAKEKINTYLERTGQQILQTDAEFVRCILESIALKVMYCIEYLKKELEIPVEKVSGVNGGSRNYVLMQFISDALGMPVYGGMPYATLAGNILTQMYSMREVTTIEEIRELSANSFEMKEYQPHAEEKERWKEDLQKMKEKGICK